MSLLTIASSKLLSKQNHFISPSKTQNPLTVGYTPYMTLLVLLYTPAYEQVVPRFCQITVPRESATAIPNKNCFLKHLHNLFTFNKSPILKQFFMKMLPVSFRGTRVRKRKYVIILTQTITKHGQKHNNHIRHL